MILRASPSGDHDPGAARIPSLDGWRAVAILLVLGSHCIYASGFPKSMEGTMLWLFDGNLGVRVFFVLSGYLISLLLIREAHRVGNLSLERFYIRRAFRILPIYYAYLALLAGLSVFGLYRDKASTWIGCLTFTRNMMGRGDSSTGHFWSLAVEEQFYVIWPVVLKLFHLWKRPLTYFFVLLIPLVFCPIIRYGFVSSEFGGSIATRILGDHSILVYADSLAVGCLGAWFTDRTSQRWEWRGWHSFAFLASLALIILTHSVQLAYPGQIVSALVPAVQAWAVITCVILSVHERSTGYRILNSRAMVTIGVLSYSLYVWHFLFLGRFSGPTLSIWPTHDWRVWLFPSVALSVLSYRFLEKPFMGLRRRFQNNRVP